MTKGLRVHYEFRMDVWEYFLSRFPKELVFRHKALISKILDLHKVNGGAK